MNANLPGFGDAETWGPCVDPRDTRYDDPDDDRLTTAGLLHECNRLIDRANNALAAKNEAQCKLYLGLLHDSIRLELGLHD